MSTEDAIWTSLPVPAILLDPQDRIAGINPAAEGFMMSSSRALMGQPVWDKLAVNAPLEEAFERARANDAPLFVNDVDVGTGERAPMQCNLQVAPLTGRPGHMIMLISPRELAGRMVQNSNVKSAAKSAIGMAEMLAHEIKNPLAGITGAAQLLSMTLGPEDLELTDLIVSESRRIVSLLERVEQFGNISAPDMRPVNVHDVLDRARRSAMLGFAAHMALVEDYDPSLPLALGDSDQLLQVVLNLLKNASEAARGSPARSACTRIMSSRSGCGAVRGRARRCLCRLKSSTMVPDCRPRLPIRCSIPLFRGARMERGWAWPWRPRSFRTMTAGFRSIPCRGARCFGFRCNGQRTQPRRLEDGWHGTGRR